MFLLHLVISFEPELPFRFIVLSCGVLLVVCLTVDTSADRKHLPHTTYQSMYNSWERVVVRWWDVA